jgi:hypothetical protein
VNAFEALLSKVVNISIEFGSGLMETIWPKDDLIEGNTVERKYDRRLFLKIKLKNLRDEVDLIRAQEERLKPWAAMASGGKAPHIQASALVHQMQLHRRTDIRDETRATLLAYGYIRGKKYEQIEQNPGYEPEYRIKARVERVAKMVNKYSVMQGILYVPSAMDNRIREWMGVDESGRRLRLGKVIPSVCSEIPVAAQAQ